MAEQQEKHESSILEQVQSILVDKPDTPRGRQIAYFAQAYLRRIPLAIQTLRQAV